jgi:molybdopterin-binding protein
MQISARNTLTGTITAVQLGDIGAEITLEVAPGLQLTASITRASAERLGLRVGQTAHAIVKASDVMIGVEDGSGR